METDLLQGCLFSRLSETESLFPWFGHHSVCRGSGSGSGEHGLRVSGRVGRILTAAPLHASVYFVHDDTVVVVVVAVVAAVVVNINLFC